MTAEEAIPIAVDAVKKFFPGSDHRLEEIELMDDGSFAITVSYRDPHAPPRPIPFGPGNVLQENLGRRAALGIEPGRSYKDVFVSPDGEVKAVRMRQVVVG